MKTILVVSYHFPPEEGSCSDKNIRIVKLLIEAGYRVVVLTKKGQWGNTMDNLLVIRSSHNGIFHKKQFIKGCTVKSATQSFNWKRKISNSIIPDAVIDWFPCVKKLFKSNYQLFEACDLILSISSPYSAHIISAWLSKKLKIPFIMCYGDPWIYERKRKKGKIRYWIEKKIEGSLLKKSSRVLLITDWNKNKYREIYNIPADKISTYHIGYDKNDMLHIVHERSNVISIVYGGSLDPVHRSPEPLLKAMANISGIHVNIYSNDNPAVPILISQLGLFDKVSLNNLVSSSKFNKIMYENDALLLFGNKTPYQVPGKVFTYIATGKLIIYLKNNDSDADGTEQVLKEYNNAIILKNEESEIEGMLLNLAEYLSKERDVYASSFEFHKTMYPILESVKSILDE